MLRTNWAGMTVQRLSARLDVGDIVHQSISNLDYGDELHDVACKAVVQDTKDISTILTTISLDQVVYHP